MTVHQKVHLTEDPCHKDDLISLFFFFLHLRDKQSVRFLSFRQGKENSLGIRTGLGV